MRRVKRGTNGPRPATGWQSVSVWGPNLVLYQEQDPHKKTALGGHLSRGRLGDIPGGRQPPGPG